MMNLSLRLLSRCEGIKCLSLLSLGGLVGAPLSSCGGDAGDGDCRRVRALAGRMEWRCMQLSHAISFSVPGGIRRRTVELAVSPGGCTCVVAQMVFYIVEGINYYVRERALEGH